MIKSILLPATGDVFDDSVLETALRVAQLAPAHIELHYFCKRFGEATETVRHVGSAIEGAALPALAFRGRQIEQQSRQALARFARICRRKGIALVATFDQRHGELACVARRPRQPSLPRPPHGSDRRWPARTE